MIGYELLNCQEGELLKQRSFVLMENNAFEWNKEDGYGLGQKIVEEKGMK